MNSFESIPLEPRKIPVLKGITAWTPVLVTEDREVIIESGVNESCDFALRADGDGMAPTILAGDLVFIRSQNSVADGEIAVVAIGDEIAIKRIFHGPGDSIQLICDNSAKYRPAIAELIGLDRIRILGRVIGLKRTL